MKYIFAVFVLVVILMLVNFRRGPSQPSESPAVSKQRTDTAQVWARGNPEVGGETNRLRPIEVKLNRLYSSYLRSPNPGYTNILNALRPLVFYDPTGTDLFKDACTFVALRTEVADLKREYESNRVEMLQWVLSRTPVSERSSAVEKFEREVPAEDIQDLQQADEAIQRVFQERFSNLHGLNGDAVVTQLSGLTLTNAGQELWIRCDESKAPFPDPPVGTYDVITH